MGFKQSKKILKGCNENYKIVLEESNYELSDGTRNIPQS